MDYDAELRLHNEALRLACDISRHDRVLDIGCGAGQTTREAARTAAAGSAVGVDISAAMIARARLLADAEREFRAMIELKPVDDYAHFALGRCLTKQNRVAEAVGHLRLATFFRPESDEYRSALHAAERKHAA